MDVDKGFIYSPTKLISFVPAIEKGMETLRAKDPGLVCTNSQAAYDPERRMYTVRVLDADCSIELDTASLRYAHSMDGHTAGALTVLVTHYLTGSKPFDPSGKLIGYRELPNGMVFYPAFRRNAIEPIAARFGEDLAAFRERAAELSGRAVGYGELGFEFMFFPRVPVTYVLWSGDLEIPASANILFDATGPYQLHTEDLAEVGEVITHLLCHEHEDRIQVPGPCARDSDVESE